ncbi:hypothetical protein B0H14DRAFT_2561538 [Mycena olivaceomarginata]|nr:hypothetical protein B0H14DRAFT_2561538 [Mycena olivaceomarginata]
MRGARSHLCAAGILEFLRSNPEPQKECWLHNNGVVSVSPARYCYLLDSPADPGRSGTCKPRFITRRRRKHRSNEAEEGVQATCAERQSRLGMQAVSEQTEVAAMQPRAGGGSAAGEGGAAMVIEGEGGAECRGEGGDDVATSRRSRGEL